ncbi:type II secretion system protein [Pseudoalteromonas sp. NFXS39]|uniref:type II secretion system protein n=1 Tax=Pseudoalteromonas sp. NFXS39 TaxID=2818437 RepID=UPI0032DEAA5B
MNKSRGLSLVHIVFLIVIVGIVASVLLPKSDDALEKHVNRNQNLSKAHKISLCKEYISKVFHKPMDIMNARYMKEDSLMSFVEISYVRKIDNTLWKYVCSISDDSILWAAILEDGSLGRWRYEEEAKISDGKVEL